MLLSKKIIKDINRKDISVPEDLQLNYPEKVLQFGTGVLLRGLPDYFIDKANKQGLFGGRVVVIKSTSTGGTDAFAAQDGLYTLCVRGLQDGKKIEEDIVVGAISRVLTASEEWQLVLACAANPAIEIVISNTTEVGIVLDESDDVTAAPPKSFPGKLLALLHHRYKIFNADKDKGWVIIPTELIVGNADLLKSIILKLAQLHYKDEGFINWLDECNHFCNSLVDRIVPGRLPAEKLTETITRLGYTDELMIMSEAYRLWAIETASEEVKKKLSFAAADNGVILANDIEKYRELKLRLLNGVHSFSCGLAVLAGFKSVLDAMENPAFNSFITQLSKKEIAAAIPSNELMEDDKQNFESTVLDRFRNPFIEHRWLSITMQYSSKMKMRNVPVILEYYKRYNKVPAAMALGFAAYILFMRSERMPDGTYAGNVNGQAYNINDDKAALLSQYWGANEKQGVVKAVLADVELWGYNLNACAGFAKSVDAFLQLLINDGAANLLTAFNKTTELV